MEIVKFIKFSKAKPLQNYNHSSVSDYNINMILNSEILSLCCNLKNPVMILPTLHLFCIDCLIGSFTLIF